MAEEYTARIDPVNGFNDVQLQVFERYMSGETITSIAKDMHIRRSTIGDWKKTKVWCDAAQKRAEENLEAHRNRLRSMAAKALDTVEDAMEGKANKTQFIAADSVLDRTLGKAKTEIEVDNHITGVAELDIDSLAEQIAKELDAEE